MFQAEQAPAPAGHSPLAWLSLATLAVIAIWMGAVGKHQAALGTAAALLGCLGLILPPRERMKRLPQSIRSLPRSLDATPVLGTILSTPGYSLGWFYGANAYDEMVHLVNGCLVGAVLIALLRSKCLPPSRRDIVLTICLWTALIGCGWELFEWATGLIGNWTDTWTDVALTALGGTLAGALANVSKGHPSGGPPTFP